MRTGRDIIIGADCPDENRLVLFVEGRLSAALRDEIERHIDTCSSCRRVLSEIARSATVRSELHDDACSTADTLRQDAASSGDEQQQELLPAGKVLAGRFAVIRMLGRGAIGTVYEAEDLQLHERVALKLLRSDLPKSSQLLRQLHHEIVISRRISHPNVSCVYDLGTCGETHFITMALVHGQSLTQRLAAGGFAGRRGADRVLAQICDALAAAHALGVVHRDLKPSNIMVTDDGHVTVMDFGLALDQETAPSQLALGARVGSPAYWSPEQGRGEKATARSDVYSLGVIACELYGAPRPVLGQAPSLRKLPARCRSVVARCLEPDPQRRFANAGVVSEALMERRSRRRHRLLFGAALGVIVAGWVALWAMWPGPPQRLQRPPAGPARVVPVTTPVAPRSNQPLDPAPRDPEAAPRVAEKVPRTPAPARRRIRRPRQARRPVRSPIVAPTPSVAPPATTPAAAAVAAAFATAALERDRRRRGLLVSDLPGYATMLASARTAAKEGQPSRATAIVERLRYQLRNTIIDGAFIKTKLERVVAYKHRRDPRGVLTARLKPIFERVHREYFSERFAQANKDLNRLWRLLEKKEKEGP